MRRDALRDCVPWLVHGQQDAVEGKSLILGHDAPNAAQNLRRRLNRRRLALERHEHVVAIG